MRSLEKRFVLKTPLNFDDVIKEAIKACENPGREIIVVGRYSQYFTYQRIKREVRKLGSSINVFYRRTKPKINLNYSEEPYFIEIDCFKFEN